MQYIEQLKREQSFDKYILFLLVLGFNKAQIIRMTGVSRQSVYNVIKRNPEVLKDLDISNRA